MAGIGFELRRLLREDTFSSFFKAFANACLYVAGPWIISTISLLLMYLIVGEGSRSFFIILAHNMAYSMIISAPIQFLLVRYVSDRIFSGETNRIFPALISAVIYVSIISFVPGIFIFSKTSEFIMESRVLFFSFFMLNSIFWVTTSLATTIKSYNNLIKHFFVFNIIIILSLVLTKDFLKEYNVIFSFNVFYMVVDLYLIYKIFSEYPSKLFFQWNFINNVKSPFIVGFTGFFYFAGLWVDKIIFWYFGFGSTHLKSIFYYNIYYDAYFFIASLIIIPVLAFITILVETDIDDKFSLLVKRVVGRKSISKILSSKEKFVKSVYSGYKMVIKYQGLLCVFFIVFADIFLYSLEKMDIIAMELNIHIFRVLIMGMFMQVLYMYQTIILFYMDAKNRILLSVILMFFFNMLFSIVIMNNIRYFGLNYVFSLLLVNGIMYIMIDTYIKNIEYHMFVNEYIISTQKEG